MTDNAGVSQNKCHNVDDFEDSHGKVQLLARAVTEDNDIYMSATSIEWREKEMKMKKKQKFPWVDLVNEAVEALNHKTLCHDNLQAKIVTTSNLKSVSDHMVKVCQNNEHLNAVQMQKFGKGLVAFQCRVFRDKPISCHNGKLDTHTARNMHPTHCECCFGFKCANKDPNDFVAQEIGAVSVHLCDVYVNGTCEGQHVGLTLEELSPHCGSCHVTWHLKKTLPIRHDDKEFNGRGYAVGKGIVNSDVIIGKHGSNLLDSLNSLDSLKDCKETPSLSLTPFELRNSVTRSISLCSCHDATLSWNGTTMKNLNARLWLWLVQHSSSVSEWTDLEAERHWPIVDTFQRPHLSIKNVCFVQQCMTHFDSKLEPQPIPNCRFTDSGRHVRSGKSVTENESLKGKTKPGGFVIGLRNDVKVDLKNSIANQIEEIAVAKNDFVLWQGDTVYQWSDIGTSNSVSGFVLHCQIKSCLHDDNLLSGPVEATKLDDFFCTFMKVAKIILTGSEKDNCMEEALVDCFYVLHDLVACELHDLVAFESSTPSFCPESNDSQIVVSSGVKTDESPVV